MSKNGFPLFIICDWRITNANYISTTQGCLIGYFICTLTKKEGIPRENKPIINYSINKIVRRYKRNDEYHDWNQPHSNRNEKQVQNSISGGAGLFATLVSALVFEVVENSEMVIDTFRKNSGTFDQQNLMWHLMFE